MTHKDSDSKMNSNLVMRVRMAGNLLKQVWRMRVVQARLVKSVSIILHMN